MSASARALLFLGALFALVWFVKSEVGIVLFGMLAVPVVAAASFEDDPRRSGWALPLLVLTLVLGSLPAATFSASLATQLGPFALPVCVLLILPPLFVYFAWTQ